MTTHKRKKVTKYRGSQTHGGGAKKKRRGAGNKGGRGRAGTGKRADSKKPCIWKDKYYFGKHGFKKKNKEKTVSISLKTLEEKAETWVSKGMMELKGGIFNVDLKRLGYGKLLGSGRIKKRFSIIVDRATEGAVEQVKHAGGNVQVILSKKDASKEEKAQEKSAKPAKEGPAEPKQ